MPARALSYDVSLLSLLREIQYTAAQIAQQPLAGAQLPVFQALRDEWKLVLMEEIDVLNEMTQAQAAVNKCDAGIDIFAGRVSNGVNEHTDGPTRKQLRTALFKNKPLSKFRRPVLSSQLAAMLDWSETLSKCNVPALMAMAPEAATLTAAGKAAESQRNSAHAKNRNFRDVGARKQFIDKVNAARKEAHGVLSKLPFENPSLPSGFADLFFYSEAPSDEEETIDEVKTAIEDLEKQLDARKAQLAKLEQAAIDEAKAAKEAQELEQSAGDLEAQAKALLDQAAAKRAQAKK